MGILFYSEPDNVHGERLERVLELIVSKAGIETFRTVRTLAGRFRMPVEPGSIAVLHAGRKEELGALLKLRDYLIEIPTILVLGDRDEDVVAKGHTLRPRLMAYQDSDYLEVAAVLARLIARGKAIRAAGPRSQRGRSCTGRKG